ncbi:hypothetical protein [Leucobacter sp. M11]|uniref:hypothetical protein n=1 Tax=Leucobacter sp. M11 TaxID=2993565 RepID=UPI002D7EE2D9|nr:hypothetical protein [Leucobacter sp. M11]MEB4614167.1 hypothetical protein [Leucobacter sp. M11]
MSIFLVGGGTVPAAESEFLAEVRLVAEERAELAGADRDSVTPVLWAIGASGKTEAAQAGLLSRATAAGIRVVDASAAEVATGTVHGVLLGAPTRAAALDATHADAERIRELVGGGAPYFGLGAGATIAGDVCIASGGEIGGVPVGPAGTTGEVNASAGLGLVDLCLEADPIASGTLPRLIAVTEAGMVPQSLAIDAATALIIGPGALRVTGSGSVWQVSAAERGVTVATIAADEG